MLARETRWSSCSVKLPGAPTHPVLPGEQPASEDRALPLVPLRCSSQESGAALPDCQVGLKLLDHHWELTEEIQETVQARGNDLIHSKWMDNYMSGPGQS